VLNAPTASATSVDLSWSAVANAGSYSIERANGLNAATGFAPIGKSATPSYSDTTVNAGTDYSYRVIATTAVDSYRVTAVGANGNSSATVKTIGATATSGAVNATTSALPAANLVAVNNLVAQANSANVMQLNWTDGSTLESGYRIQRCTGNVATTCAPLGAGWANVTTGIAPAGALISAANGPMTTTLTANLAQNTISYRVYPLNGATLGPVSNTVTVIMNGSPIAPTTVTATPAVGSVALTWVDNANNNTEYRIRSRYQTAPGIWSAWTNATVNPAVGANAQAATLTAAQIGANYLAGRTFQFQVGARNQAATTYASSANVVVQ
jgi:fibronectin type 3 domain-containing protein